MMRLSGHPLHGVEHDHGQLRLRLILTQGHASYRRAERVTHDVAGTRLVQGKREDVVATPVARAQLGVQWPQRLVGRPNGFFECVDHTTAWSDTGNARVTPT